MIVSSKIELGRESAPNTVECRAVKIIQPRTKAVPGVLAAIPNLEDRVNAQHCHGGMSCSENQAENGGSSRNACCHG